jgi:predicted transcriptional regulator
MSLEMTGIRKDHQIDERRQISAALRKGKKDVKAGRVKSHSEVEKMVARWTKHRV